MRLFCCLREPSGDSERTKQHRLNLSYGIAWLEQATWHLATNSKLEFELLEFGLLEFGLLALESIEFESSACLPLNQFDNVG